MLGGSSGLDLVQIIQICGAVQASFSTYAQLQVSLKIFPTIYSSSNVKVPLYNHEILKKASHPLTSVDIRLTDFSLLFINYGFLGWCLGSVSSSFALTASCLEIGKNQESQLGAVKLIWSPSAKIYRQALWIRNGRPRITVEVNEGLDTPGPEVAGGLERGVLGDVGHDEADGWPTPVRPVDLPPQPVHPGQRRQGRRRARQQAAEQQDKRCHLAPRAAELQGHGWNGLAASKQA